MKAYLVLTGSIFGLIALLHLNRLLHDGVHAFAADPWLAWGNLAGVLIGAGIAGWAGWLLGTHQALKDRGSEARGQ